MIDVEEHLRDAARPVIQVVGAPDLRGGWRIEVQAVFLDGRKVTKTGLGTGKSAAGLIAAVLELLQEAADEGVEGLPVASFTLWTVAQGEAEQ